MHLQPEPLFSLPTDNVGMLDIQGTPEGRIFLGGKDGYLYEVVYQAEDGWFSRKCKKLNHSISMLSFLVPSFLSFSEEGLYYIHVCTGVLYVLSTMYSLNNNLSSCSSCALICVIVILSLSMQILLYNFWLIVHDKFYIHGANTTQSL
jgi:hypothetical protein